MNYLLLGRHLAWLVLLIPLFLGDALIGFYDPIVMLAVYVGFALSALIGCLLLSRERSNARDAGAAVSAALVFYAVSNFGIWYAGMFSAQALALRLRPVSAAAS